MNNKDLIMQYVDTGLKIPNYQVANLPNWSKKTYIRKRLISVNNEINDLSSYELSLVDDETLMKYFDNGGYLDRDFSSNLNATKSKSLSPEMYRYYKESRVKFGHELDDYDYSILSDEVKKIYISKVDRYSHNLSYRQFESTPKYLKKEYLELKKTKTLMKNWETWEVKYYNNMGIEDALDEYKLLNDDADRLRFLFDLLEKFNPTFIEFIKTYKDKMGVPMSQEIVNNLISNLLTNEELASEFARLYDKYNQ